MHAPHALATFPDVRLYLLTMLKQLIFWLQAKVSAPTRAGRALRRSLLKGCVIVIVVAGYSGKRFIYERAHELGVRCATGPM